MKIRFGGVLTVGVVLFVCCGCNNETKSDTKHPESLLGSEVTSEDRSPAPAEVFVLSEPELRRLKPLALRGDAEAAERLYYHYSVVDTSPAGQAIAARWKQYAAENGNANAMMALSDDLSSTGSADDCVRANFWMDRIRKLRPEQHWPEKVPCVFEIH